MTPKNVYYMKGSPKQKLFLQARAQTETDKAAAAMVGITTRAVRKWKEDPEFSVAYDTIVEGDLSILSQALEDDHEQEEVSITPLPAPPLTDIEVETPDDIKQVVVEQLQMYSQYIPSAFRRLVDIILNGQDHHSLKALEMYFRLYDITTDVLKPEDMPVIHQQILNWTQVNVGEPSGGDSGGKDDNEDDKAGATEIEGTFREMPPE